MNGNTSTDKEEHLLFFWLPLRKSNFINKIDDDNPDNLINKVIQFIFEYRLDVKNFLNIELNNYSYDNIFNLRGEVKNIKKKNEYVKKHIIKRNESSTDLEKEISANKSLFTNFYRLEVKNNMERKVNQKGFSFNLNYKRKYDINSFNKIHFRFSFTDASFRRINKRKFKNIAEESKILLLLRNMDFNFVIDEYGFYFISFKLHKNIVEQDLIKAEVKNLFISLLFSIAQNKKKSKKNFDILTYDQKNIIMHGLLFKYNNSYGSDRNIEKVYDFFKKNTFIYKISDFNRYEKFDTKTKAESKYILDKRNDHELKERVYKGLPFFENAYKLNKDFNSDLVKKWILNSNDSISEKKLERLYNLFLQDQIEKEAVSRFLETSTSIEYIGEIINVVKQLRDNLRDVIVKTTSSQEDEAERFLESKGEKNEDELTREIEKIFSKIPNLKTIDTFLQEAYYMKIGNYSMIGRMENSESILVLYEYAKWKSLLENIDNTSLSLKTILDTYQSNQALEEIRELSRNELSTSDKNDVRNILEDNKIILDNEHKDFLIILSFFVAFSNFYKDSWFYFKELYQKITNSEVVSIFFSILTFIIILLLLIKTVLYITKYFSKSKEKKSIKFYGINTLELRSRKKLGKKEIIHEKDHYFVRKIDKVIDYIEKKADDKLLNKGKRRILFSRVNPSKRVIQIKYIFDKKANENLYDLSFLGIENKDIKIKFFIVYRFVLKLENNKFKIYNNFIKVYYNIGSNERISHKYDNRIRIKLYESFLKNFNIHKKK